MEQRIFRPLQLNHTELATATTIRAAHAHGYVIGTNAPLDVTTTAEDMRGLLGSGSGAIVSTVDDLTRFYTALLGDRLLPAKQLEQMLTPFGRHRTGPTSPQAATASPRSVSSSRADAPGDTAAAWTGTSPKSSPTVAAATSSSSPSTRPAPTASEGTTPMALYRRALNSVEATQRMLGKRLP